MYKSYVYYPSNSELQSGAIANILFAHLRGSCTKRSKLLLIVLVISERPANGSVKTYSKAAGNANGQLRNIRNKNHIIPQQSLLAQSMNMPMVIDPKKKYGKYQIGFL